MSRRKQMRVRCLAVTCVLLTAPAGFCQAQPESISTSNTQMFPSQFPVGLYGKVVAMGDRLQKPGKERVVITGTLTQSGKTSSAKISCQLPNEFRIDQTGRSFGFSGTGSWDAAGSLAAADEDLMETFLDDSPEATFFALLHTARVRVIGLRVRMDDGTTPHYSGPWSDIFQVLGPSQSRSDRAARQKNYYFDSQTQLLSEVRYRILRAGTTIEVKSQRSNWATVNGQAVPGTITRIENGKTIFTFNANITTLSAAASDGTFAGAAGN
jgi:hypothetical protein